MTRTPARPKICILKELQTILFSKYDYGDKADGVLFSYAGPISDSSSNSIVTLVENSVTQCGTTRAELLKAKRVINEMLKSMRSHGWIDEKGETMLFSTLISAENRLNICSGVLINNELTKAFKSKIDQVNSMSKADLRKRSVELLCNKEKFSMKDPDLSIINIALNCDRPIDVVIKNIGENLNILKVYVAINHSLAYFN